MIPSPVQHGNLRFKRVCEAFPNFQAEEPHSSLCILTACFLFSAHCSLEPWRHSAHERPSPPLPSPGLSTLSSTLNWSLVCFPRHPPSLGLVAQCLSRRDQGSWATPAVFLCMWEGVCCMASGGNPVWNTPPVCFLCAILGTARLTG